LQRTIAFYHSMDGEPQQERVRWIIEPGSAVRAMMDFCSLVCVFTDVMFTPYMLAWNVELHGTMRHASVLLIFFWTLDIVVSFRTGYYSNGELEMRPSSIARNYMSKFFLLDLVLLLMDVIHILFRPLAERTAGMLRISKVSRMLRLLGFLRMYRFSYRLKSISAHHAFDGPLGHGLEVLKLLLCIFCFNHIVSCTWYAIGSVGPDDTQVRWTNLSISPGSPVTYATAPFWYQYFSSYHWSLTQIHQDRCRLVQ